MTVKELFIAWQEWETDTQVVVRNAGMDYLGAFPWANLLLKRYGDSEVVSFGFKDGNRDEPIILSIEE